MTDIGELVVRIKADTGDMQQSLSQVTSQTKQSAEEMAGAFESVRGALETLGVAFGIGEVVEFTKGALEAADSFYIMAQRIGFASDTLSALNIPLKQNGSSIEEFANSVKFMNRNIELASQGNQALLDRFDDLHLSVTKLKALSPEEQFFAIAKALGETATYGQLTTDSMAILGRGAAGLNPIIKETNGNLRDVIKTQQDLGNTLTDEEIKKVHEYEDAWISFVEHLKIKVVEGVLAIHQLAEAGRELRNEDTLSGVGGIGSAPGPNDWSGSAGHYTPTLDTSPGHDTPPTDAVILSAAGNNNALRPPPKPSELQPYIDKLKEEADAAAISQKALFIRNAEIEAGTKAMQDYQNGLRDNKKLTDDEMASVDAAAAALYDHKEALTQNKQIADQLTNSLTKIIMNFKDMKSAITDLFNSVAQEMIKTQIAKPLATSLTSSLPSISGGFSSLTSSVGNFFGGFFADGGTPPVGIPSVVGENGPELFVPNQAGTIIPNGSMGGQSVVVYQTFNMQPGLAETVGAAIRQASPQIMAMTHAGIMQAIQKGGAESRIVGRRS